jgi:hypothetical protein
MKGEIKINFKFKKSNPLEFTKAVVINGITPFHIASAINTLIEILEKHATEDDQRRIIEALNNNAKFANVNIVTKGDA